MGVHTLADFPAHLGRTVAATQSVQHRGISAGALVMKTVIVGQVAAVAPGMRLRGVGKAGGKLGVRYKVYGSGVSTFAAVSATGPMHLIERNVGAHRITGVRNRRKSVQWATSGTTHPYAASPGTKGKHPFAKGVAVGSRLWEKGYNEIVSETVTRAFSL